MLRPFYFGASAGVASVTMVVTTVVPVFVAGACATIDALTQRSTAQARNHR